MRLILVRHGQTPSNVGFLLDTAAPGPGLTPLGHRQAAALPRVLAGEDVQALYASTLVRTQLTAAPLAAARGLDVVVRDGIREILAGELEMADGWGDAGRVYLETVHAWIAGDTALRMPGGESGDEALGRLDEVVAEVAGLGVDTATVVGHGAAIRLWAGARAHNLDVDFVAARRLDNTGAVVLEGSLTDGWRAVSWAGSAVPVPGPAAPPAGGPAGRPLDETE